MALTKCADCGREVSPRASACPQCGGPLPGATPHTTTERTARELKALLLKRRLAMAAGLIMAPCAFLFLDSPAVWATLFALGLALALFGAVGAMRAKALMWWRHG